MKPFPVSLSAGQHNSSSTENSAQAPELRSRAQRWAPAPQRPSGSGPRALQFLGTAAGGRRRPRGAAQRGGGREASRSGQRSAAPAPALPSAPRRRVGAPRNAAVRCGERGGGFVCAARDGRRGVGGGRKAVVSRFVKESGKL